MYWIYFDSMRLQQLRSLTVDEQALLLYVMNDFGNRTPEISSVDELRWFKNEPILWRLSKAQSELNDDGKLIFMELMRKLNMQAHEEATEFAEKNKPEYAQSEFELYSQLEFKYE